MGCIVLPNTLAATDYWGVQATGLSISGPKIWCGWVKNVSNLGVASFARIFNSNGNWSTNLIARGVASGDLHLRAELPFGTTLQLDGAMPVGSWVHVAMAVGASDLRIAYRADEATTYTVATDGFGAVTYTEISFGGLVGGTSGPDCKLTGWKCLAREWDESTVYGESLSRDEIEAATGVWAFNSALTDSSGNGYDLTPIDETPTSDSDEPVDLAAASAASSIPIWLPRRRSFQALLVR